MDIRRNNFKPCLGVSRGAVKYFGGRKVEWKIEKYFTFFERMINKYL
jgi:hypothetical protein